MTDAEAVARVEATVDVADAAARTWDVLVVGAGPGGAFTAREAARAGLATLLVERSAFPRAKVCGGCLNHTAVATLRRAGLGDRLARLGGPPIAAVRLRHEGRQATVPVPEGVAVSRRALDAMLVETAVEAGARFLPKTTALLAREPADGGRPGHRVVELRPGGRAGTRTAARVVVVADGLGQTSLKECGEFTSVVSGDARIGVGTVAPAGVLALPPGTITMAVGRAGYAGLVEVEGGRCHVAAALDPAFSRRCGSPARSVASLLAEAGVEGVADLDGLDWLGTLPLTRRTSRPAGHRVLLVGDAAGYVEPFTGEGMAWALAAADSAVPFLRRGLDAWDGTLERGWAALCDDLTGRQRRACRMMARALRSPWAVRAAVGLLARRPSLARPVVAGLGASPRTTTGGTR
jgi:menaquinone-9 beta-reductase